MKLPTPISLVIFAVILSFQDGCLGQAEDGCQFWYFVVPPVEVDWCNPDGVDIPLFCGVYVPQNVPTTVKWYQSKTEDLAGVSGTLIIEEPLKYSMEVTRSADPIVNGMFMGLFYDQHSLRITNFNQSDSGYYWCQLIVNETTELNSSPFGYVAVNPVPVSCLTSDIRYFNIIDDGLCAEISQTTSPTMTSLATTLVVFSRLVHPSDSISLPGGSTLVHPSDSISLPGGSTLIHPSESISLPGGSTLIHPSESISSPGGSLLSSTVLPTQIQTGSDNGEDQIPVYVGIGVAAGAGLVMCSATVAVFVAVCVSRGKKEKTKGGVNKDIQLQPYQTIEDTYAVPYHPAMITQTENQVISGYAVSDGDDQQQLLKIMNPDHECDEVREQNATNMTATASRIPSSSSSVPLPQKHLVSCATVLSNIQDHTYGKVQCTTSEESAQSITEFQSNIFDDP